MLSTRRTKGLSALRADVESVLESVPIDFGGGCSASKATLMAHLIKSEQITRSIDIGIYRGRSFFPQGLVHTRDTGGYVIGIDPYTKVDAMEHDHEALKDQIAEFVDTTDFDEMYETVDGLRKTLGVADGSRIMRMRSDEAAPILAEAGETFGLTHIDGNHDTGAVLKDLELYLPLLDDQNGFLVFDDISWPSVKPAVDRANEALTLLYARVDSYNDYAVFWTGTDARKKNRLRQDLGLAGEG